MPAYIHGNLAVDERRNPSQRVKIKETRKVVYRASRLPVQEKLLYLFTVLICVVVAGAIIWRYAQIYEMNTRIQTIEKQIRQLEAENSTLKEKISKEQDPEKRKKDMQSAGLAPIQEKHFIRVPAKDAGDSSDDLALKP